MTVIFVLLFIQSSGEKSQLVTEMMLKQKRKKRKEKKNKSV
jgi:hypothetical protein